MRKWGLTKYLKADKVRQAREQAAGGKLALPLIRGRVAAPRALKRELSEKMPGEYATLTSSRATSRTVSIRPRSRTVSLSPIDTHVDAPQQYKHIEICIAAVLEYSQNRFQASKWDPTDDLETDDYSDMWQNKVLTAFSLIRNGKLKGGFRLIDISLKRYKMLIVKEHPLLIIETYTTFLYLAVHRADLAETMIRYIASLCRICLGPAHPFTRIWGSLALLGMEQLRQASGVVLKTNLAMLTTYFKPDVEFLLNQRVDTARQAHCFGSLSIEEAEADIAYAISLKQQKGQKDTANFVCWAKEMQAYIYKWNKKYDEALALLDEVGHYIESGSEVDDFGIGEWYSIRCMIVAEIGTYDEITSLFRERLDWIVSAVGTTHHWTMRAITELDAQYEKRGDVDASAKLHAQFDFESTWDVLCKKEDSRSETVDGATHSVKKV